MFSDIIGKKEMDHILKTYKQEGENSAGTIILDIIIELFKRKKETIRRHSEDSTVMRLFKLNKQKKELQKGFNEVTDFYEFLEKHGMETFNIANIKCDELLDFLTIEKRILSERITAVLEVYAGILALVIALVAIFVSIFT
jgi:hypothetical protein